MDVNPVIKLKKMPEQVKMIDYYASAAGPAPQLLSTQKVRQSLLQSLYPIFGNNLLVPNTTTK